MDRKRPPWTTAMSSSMTVARGSMFHSTENIAPSIESPGRRLRDGAKGSEGSEEEGGG